MGERAFYDTRPPVVTFANVKSGDVLRGTTIIKLKATDDSGEAPLVSLLVDNALKLIKNRPPYDYDLDTTTYVDGSHELQTYAYDASGNRSDPAVVKVTFNNNLKRPVVSSLDVKPAEPAGEEGRDTVESLPPVAVISALAGSKHGAGRVSEQEVKSIGVAAGPIALHKVSKKPAHSQKPASAKLAAPARPAFVSGPANSAVAHSAPKLVAVTKTRASLRSGMPTRPAVSKADAPVRMAYAAKSVKRIAAPLAASPRRAPVGNRTRAGAHRQRERGIDLARVSPVASRCRRRGAAVSRQPRCLGLENRLDIEWPRETAHGPRNVCLRR